MSSLVIDVTSSEVSNSSTVRGLTHIEVKPNTIYRGFTMSSVLLDTLVREILDADLRDEIEIPARLGANANYGRDLQSHYRPQDIEWLAKKVNVGFSDNELCVLDALTRWAFRNTGDLMRSALGLIGSVVSANVAMTARDTPLQAETIDSRTAYNSFVVEDIWTIRRIIKSATTVGAIDAKIPLHSLSSTFDELSALPNEDRRTPIIAERERQARLMATVTPTSNLSENNMDRVDFAAGRLIQMTKSVATYKREDGFGRLRSFLTNGSMLATLIRVKANDGHQLSRLCSDILDILHSIDRLLNSNCVAANGLIERMARGELVYDEILNMGKQQHRIMAVEFAGAITLFSYLLKQADLTLHDDMDVKKAAGRLLHYSGIAEQYANEIMMRSSD